MILDGVGVVTLDEETVKTIQRSTSVYAVRKTTSLKRVSGSWYSRKWMGNHRCQLVEQLELAARWPRITLLANASIMLYDSLSGSRDIQENDIENLQLVMFSENENKCPLTPF